MITIKHNEISAATANRLGKGFTADTVSKTVTEYAKAMSELLKNKMPKSKDDWTLVQTPIAGFKINYRDTGVKKNDDGSEQKVGTNYTVNVALPRFFLDGLNAGIEIIKTIVNAKKAA